MKICSFLPGGTETVCALGLADSLVGISHECDYPPGVRAKPVVVRSAVDTAKMSSREIGDYVSRAMKSGESLYRVDEAKLRELKPDVIITQDLCGVCAPSGPEAKKALAAAGGANVVTLAPHTLDDVFDEIRLVGEATGALEQAKDLVWVLRNRCMAVQCTTYFAEPKPRVFVLEWLDPPYTAGHWIPHMVELAGGVPDRSTDGKESVRTTWEEIAAFNPDVLICSPCGYHLERAVAESIKVLKACPCPEKIEAFRTGRIYAVDADSYLVRPGPRVVDGLELLAHMLHPDRWPGGPQDAFKKLEI